MNEIPAPLEVVVVLDDQRMAEDLMLTSTSEDIQLIFRALSND